MRLLRPSVTAYWLERAALYLYQNFPGPRTAAKNEDGTPMRDWWVYLFY